MPFGALQAMRRPARLAAERGRAAAQGRRPARRPRRAADRARRAGRSGHDGDRYPAFRIFRRRPVLDAARPARRCACFRTARPRTRPIARARSSRVHETGEWLILDLAETPDDAYSVIPDLKAEGYTALHRRAAVLHQRHPQRHHLRHPGRGRVSRRGRGDPALRHADAGRGDGDAQRQQAARPRAADLCRRRAAQGDPRRLHPARPGAAHPLRDPVRRHARLHPHLRRHDAGGGGRPPQHLLRLPRASRSSARAARC